MHRWRPCRFVSVIVGSYLIVEQSYQLFADSHNTWCVSVWRAIQCDATDMIRYDAVRFNTMQLIWFDMMQCDSMRCNWYDSIWCNAMTMRCNWYDSVWCNAIQCDATDMIRYDAMRFNAMQLIWFDMMQCDAMRCNWYDSIWCNAVQGWRRINTGARRCVIDTMIISMIETCTNQYAPVRALLLWIRNIYTIMCRNKSVCQRSQTAGHNSCSIVSGNVSNCSHHLTVYPVTSSRLSSA